MNCDEYLMVGAKYLLEVPLSFASMTELANSAKISEADILRYYTDIHDLSSAILDYERDAMRKIQDRLDDANIAGLSKIVKAFSATGLAISEDPIIQAAVRMASESRFFFPERKLNPFDTWKEFVETSLIEAEQDHSLTKSIPILEARDLVVSSGVGIKNYIVIHECWGDAERLFDRIANNFTVLLES